jgi:D-alanyl-D-alanine carboxypeptidase
LLASLVAVGALGAGQPALAGTADPSLGPRDGLSRDLQRQLDDIRNRDHVRGISFSVILPGQTSGLTFVSGTAPRPDDHSHTKSGLFQAGSIIKTMTTAVVLELEASKRVRLSDRVDKFLPQYPAWGTITIEQLLNMTGGIHDFVSDPRFLPAVVAMPDRHWKRDELLQMAYSATPNTSFAAGAGWEYSNTNALLLSAIVEQVTHHSFATELQGRVLGPRGANLTDTYYVPASLPPRLSRRMVHGSNQDGTFPVATDVTTFSLSWAGPAGALVSTTADLATWIRNLFRGHVLQRRQLNELMQLVSTTNGHPTDWKDPNAYGLGMDYSNDPTVGPAWFKGGNTLGYVAFVASLLCLNTTLAIAKTDTGPNAVTDVQNMIIATLTHSARFHRSLSQHPSTQPANRCPQHA